MVSIIIVNYQVKQELFACIASIKKSKTDIPYEIIVVDNDERKTIFKELHKKYPDVRYIPNLNKGFGQANNVGARRARGDFLFFLNPDTRISPKTVDMLVTFLQKKKKVGIVAPLLLGKDNKPYQQGSLALTPARGMVALSFLNKLFPTNPISKKYFLSVWDRKSVQEVDVVPGTALCMKRELFEKIGGFDERFFLFFEEFDLCKRVKALGWKLFITPDAKVSHAWGSSTKQRQDIQKIFAKSRFFYFRKHFGLLSAFLTEVVVQVNKYTIFLSAVLSLGVFLLFYRLQETMIFIGDQGWYYLSARDMLLTGEIPLVGIASSHPWLHQGALWTYLLGIGFWGMGFSPFVGAYMSILCTVIATFLLYKLGAGVFSKHVGIIAAALFLLSPLVIVQTRMPYHTSPIPLFTIIFLYFLYKWISGNVRYFPLLIATLAILYNLEIATFLLSVVTLVLLFYGFIAKKAWAKGISKGSTFLFSVFCFLFPMVPMLIYDFFHGFPQTVGFLIWLGYRVLVFFGYPPMQSGNPASFSEMFSFLAEQYQRFIFSENGWVALAIFVFSVIFFIFSFQRNRKYAGTLLVFNGILLLGIFASRTPSEAYIPMLLPGIVLFTAIGFAQICNYKGGKSIASIIIIFLMLINSWYVLSHAFVFYQNPERFSFAQKLAVAKQIVKESNGEEYSLKGKGSGSQFASFTMNYAYLTWWLGHGPSEKPQKLQFIIEEDKEGIQVQKIVKKEEML